MAYVVIAVGGGVAYDVIAVGAGVSCVVIAGVQESLML